MPTTAITVSLATDALRVGAATQATATVTTTESDGLVDARPIAWASRDPAVATVDANGLVTGVAAGTATIDAIVEGVRGSATVTVSVPTVGITQTQQDAITGFAAGSQFVLRGPSMDITCQIAAGA